MSVPNLALLRPVQDNAPTNDLLDLMQLDPPLSAGARLVYVTLMALNVNDLDLPPSLPELAALAGVGHRSLTRWMVELRERGLVRSRRRGHGRTQLYTITRPADVWSSHVRPAE